MTEIKIATGRRLLASGIPPKEVAEALGVSVATLYRHIPAAASVVPT